MKRYMIYVDGALFYDSRIEELAVVDPVLTLEDNSAGELTFSVPPEHPLADKIRPVTSTIEVFQDTHDDAGWLFTGRVMEPSGDYLNQAAYYCEGALAFLNDSVVRQRYFQNATPQSYIKALLDNHNNMVDKSRQIQLGAVTVTDPNEAITCYWNYNPSFQELKEDISDDLGGHIRIRRRNGVLYLDALAEYGTTSGQVIEFGENLIDLEQACDFSKIATVVIPLGARLEEPTEDQVGTLDEYITIKDVNRGYDYITSSEQARVYGNHWEVVEWSNVHVPSILKSKAEAYLNDLQYDQLEITVKALDLHYTDSETAAIRLGDRVRVISKPHGIDRYFPVSKLELHLDDVSQNVITLGGNGEPSSITGATNRVTITTGQIKDEMREPNRLIDEAVHRATELINQGLSGHVVISGNEILIMDTDDPKTAKYVWRWNSGGLGFSKNGYNGPFETAITMDGTIVGKFIAANSIAADQLSVEYRKTVTDQFDAAKEFAQEFTSGELKNYYTKEQVTTQLKTNSDSILLSAERNAELYVDGKLTGNYYTKSQIDVKLDEIESTVKKEFNDYPTIAQMESKITQKANEITSSVSSTYTTKNEFGKLETTVKSVENKVTSDGIFTTINSGLKGTKNFKTTKFTIDKDGITVQGGGITIKNDSGKDVLYADTRGNLSMVGSYYLKYGTTDRNAITIYDNSFTLYDYGKSSNPAVFQILNWGSGSSVSPLIRTQDNRKLRIGCQDMTHIILDNTASGYGTHTRLTNGGGSKRGLVEFDTTDLKVNGKMGVSGTLTTIYQVSRNDYYKQELVFEQGVLVEKSEGQFMRIP